MQTVTTITETMRCGLEMTKNARNGIMKWATDEHAFFRLQESFHVHIEKRPQNQHGNMSFSIFFDNEMNQNLSNQLNNRVAVMDCIYKNEGFLATGFHVRGRKEPVRTNRRYVANIQFVSDRNRATHMPIELYTALRELPIADERSAYVAKRIASWEGYLRIQEMNADVADITTSFTAPRLNEDFSKLQLVCSGLAPKEWQSIKGLSANIKGTGQDLGNVLNVNRHKKMIEIELNNKFKEMARRGEFQPKSYHEIIFSNFAELSQVRRLRKGFKDLQEGFAANANLEKVLFEERPVVQISKEKKNLVFHNNLNEFQQEAVTGAMTANDLYVIQGPPGTGKTTVISEICHQNVKAGLRTLVASQANLAVDNALGRLFSHQDIRILRYGRTDSIEEEGKKFIEENVALNWKKQTLDAVNQQLSSHEMQLAQLQDELAFHKEELQVIQTELVAIEEKILLKEQAKIKHLTLSNSHSKSTRRTEKLTQKRFALSEDLFQATKSYEKLTDEIAIIEEQLTVKALNAEEILAMEKLEREINELQEYINYLTILERKAELKTSQVSLLAKREGKHKQIKVFERFLEETLTILKLDQLEHQLVNYNIKPASATQQKINMLQQLISEVKKMLSDDDHSEWQQLNERLIKAIDTTEELLKTIGAFMITPPKTAERKYRSVKEINELINRIATFLIAPKTKRILENRSYSAENYDTHEKIAIALDLLKKQRSYVQSQMVAFDQQQQMIANAKNQFAVVKTEIIGDVNQRIFELERDSQSIEQEATGLEKESDTLQARITSCKMFKENVHARVEVQDAKEQLKRKSDMLTAYTSKRITLEESSVELDTKRNDLAASIKKRDENKNEIEGLDLEIKELEQESIGREEELARLVKQLNENLEELRERKLAASRECSKGIEKNRIKKERLPISFELQKEWLSLLTQASDYDLDEIRKLYVQHANVIGTTCVASARRDFMEEYPTFDVVIIDEVSKATPPELLLPMLKGKKIILVGDHHQLPPLMGQETLEEFLEESSSHDEKRELEKLLKESLFERLFRTLPKQNKTMLGIQYRMHESIMETITPFYEEGNYSLQCGLNDSDKVRDHLMDGKLVKRRDHLLWFDVPNEPDYFEEQVKGGTSRFNQAELSKIKNLLIDLEAATIKAKQEGLMASEEKKSVGVISFYGEQVKRIDRLIQQDLNLAHLHCRTGSVDKFQGMEMDIIILSFVRNHQSKSGDIGFAKDYRRLNVALSRARELLIIVGSADMFTKRPKNEKSRQIYKRLLEQVKDKTGYRDLVEVR